MAYTKAYKEHIMYTFNGFCKVVIRYADFSGIGNQTAPTPGTERRRRHKPYPFGIRRTLLPCRQSGEGIHKGANL